MSRKTQPSAFQSPQTGAVILSKNKRQPDTHMGYLFQSPQTGAVILSLIWIRPDGNNYSVSIPSNRGSHSLLLKEETYHSAYEFQSPQTGAVILSILCLIGLVKVCLGFNPLKPGQSFSLTRRNSPVRMILAQFQSPQTGAVILSYQSNCNRNPGRCKEKTGTLAPCFLNLLTVSYNIAIPSVNSKD